MKISYLSSPYVSFLRAAASYRWCLRRLGHEVDEKRFSGDVVILHGEPQDFPGVLDQGARVAGRPVVGYVAWEHEAMGAEQLRGLARLDQVWVPSAFCRERIARYHPDVHVVPHVTAPPLQDAEARTWVEAEIGHRPDTFYFYAITRPGDPRKNLAATVRAFADLGAGSGVRLLVKAAAGSERLVSDMPGVVALSGAWSNARLNALHGLGHVFVNSHRAEGWGLGITEAMSAGRIAIATAHGGNTDYMTPANSFLLPWSPVPVPRATLPDDLRDTDAARALTWAEVDGEALLAAMRTALDGWDRLAPMRRQAERDMMRFRPENISALLQQRLAALVG